MDEFYNIINYINQAITLTLGYFNSPNKRIYYFYIISSLVIAIVVFYSKKRRTSLFRYLFNRKTWLSESAFIDYAFLFFNSLIKVVFIAPFLIFSLKIAFYTHEYLIDSFGYLKSTIHKNYIIGLYTITLFVIGDFSSFMLHYVQHKIPFLWRFHAIHHSATVLNPITQYRIHPVELIMNNIKSILLIGFLMGTFEFLANGRISYYTFNGVNIFNFIFLFFGANLRHSGIKLKYPVWLEHVFISPFQHQIHHSNNEKHFDKNMGQNWQSGIGYLVH